MLPGNDLMRLFLERSARANCAAHGDPDARGATARARCIDQTAYNKLRSVMTRKDEWQRAQDQMHAQRAPSRTT